MRLTSQVVIRRTPEQVWSILADPFRVPQWDRGVAAVELSSPEAYGPGFEFSTLARKRRPHRQPDWGRMSYRVVESGEDRCTLALTSSSGNARFFRTACWHFRVEPLPEGSRLTCTAEFRLKLRYLVLGPVLFAFRRAIRSDLESLRRLLEENEAA